MGLRKLLTSLIVFIFEISNDRQVLWSTHSVVGWDGFRTVIEGAEIMTWQKVLIPIAIAGLLQSTVALAQFGMGAVSR